MSKTKVKYVGNSEFAKVRRLIARQAAPNVSPSDIQALRVLRTMPEPGFLFTIAEEPTGRTPKAKDNQTPLALQAIERQWAAPRDRTNKEVQRLIQELNPGYKTGAVALAKLPMAHLNG